MTGHKTTQDLAPLLAPGQRSALFRLAGRTSAGVIASIAEAAGWRFLHLDLGNVDSKYEFLKAAGTTLGFPEWAGHNWDAFEELVNDLSWLPPAEGYLLLIERSSRLADADEASLRMALDILGNALAARKPGDAPFLALARGAGALASRLPAVAVEKTPRKGSAS